MLPARLATAAVAIPLLLCLIFWAPPWGLCAVVSALAVLAMAEFAGLAFPAQPRERALALGLGAAVVITMAFGPGPWVTAMLAAFVATGLAWIVFSRSDLERGLADFGLMAV